MLRICVLALAMLLTAGAAGTEEILLKDGTKVTGKIVGVNGDVFVIKTTYGEIQVPRADIVNISFPENAPKEEEEAAGPIDEKLEGNLYTNRTEGFRVQVPDGWRSQLAEFRKGNKDVVAALTSDDSTLIFLVTPEKYNGSLKSYAGLADLQYQSLFNEYEKLSETPITVDGRAGLRMLWRGRSKENNAPIQSLVIILPHEGKMVRLSFLTVLPLFDEALPVFEKVLKSYAKLQP